MDEIIKKILSERKARQLLKIGIKIQEDSSVLDLEDFDCVFDLLKKNNQLEIKKRNWGAKMLDYMSESQKLDFDELEDIKEELFK